ncbi:MJ0042-type zinc finger domain-containing protein [Iodidimonas sp. MBR-14]|uniref:MJ0042-type zinc finger domain-containing protein n=1 Tax=Iodidimonas sp. MBR-14 TaxID=3032319 RepID=UPI0024829592|nr:MJ0042-type zinc finger domain-containing protein [Iodidimonas sp. MBR-14]
MTCPHCAVRFHVPPDLLGPEGRRVRCGSCAHIWHAMPDEAEAEPNPKDKARANPAKKQGPASKNAPDPQKPAPDSVDSVIEEESQEQILAAIASAMEKAGLSDGAESADEDQQQDDPAGDEDKDPFSADLPPIDDTPSEKIAPQKTEDVPAPNAPHDDLDDAADEDWTHRDPDDDPPFDGGLDDDEEDAPRYQPGKTADFAEDVARSLRRLRDEESIYGAAPVPALRPKPSRFVLFGWAAYGLFVIALLGGFLAFAPSLTAAWPPIGRLYALIGMDAAPKVSADQGTPEAAKADATRQPASPISPDEALTVALDPDPEWQARDYGWDLRVSGSVSNRLESGYEVPALTLLLVDSAGETLQRTPVILDETLLNAGKATRFSVQIENAPAQTTGIVHEWQERSPS